MVEYVDGLLLVDVKRAIRERINRPWIVQMDGQGAAERKNTEPSFGLLRELIFWGQESGLSEMDVAEALEVSEEYVHLIGQTGR